MYIKMELPTPGTNATAKNKRCASLEDYKLWVRFSNGEVKIFDFSKELNSPAFSPLKDKAIFNSVYIDYGVTVWNDGDIDIAPEYLYKNGVSVGGPSIVG